MSATIPIDYDYLDGLPPDVRALLRELDRPRRSRRRPGQQPSLQLPKDPDKLVGARAILSAFEAAGYSMSPDTFARWAAQGKLPVQKEKGRWTASSKAVTQWKPTPEEEKCTP